MRKLLLLTSVFAITYGAFAQNPSFSGIATEGTLRTVAKENTQKEVLAALKFIMEQSLPKMSQQDATIQAANISQTMRGMSAVDQNATNRAQQEVIANSGINNLNLADIACVHASGVASAGKVHEHAESVSKQTVDELAGISNQNKGTIAENARTDMFVKLANQRKSVCDPNSFNGEGNCSGQGGPHADISVFEGNDPTKINYAKNLISAATMPISINPVLLGNSTNAKVYEVLSDIGRFISSATSKAFADYIASNDKVQDALAIKSLNERFESAGYAPNYLAQGLSKEDMLKALTIGSTGPSFVNQKLISQDRALLATIAGELIISNLLAYENRLLLQNISNNTAMTNLALGNEFTRDALDPMAANQNKGR